jgi:type III secretory pathway component EscU
MRRASIEHYIPAELIEPVAEVLRMVRREPTQGDPL